MCVSSMIYSGDTPFWSETFDMQLLSLYSSMNNCQSRCVTEMHWLVAGTLHVVGTVSIKKQTGFATVSCVTDCFSDSVCVCVSACVCVCVCVCVCACLRVHV